MDCEEMMLNAPEDLCLPEKQHQRDENLSDDPSNPVNIRSDSKACDVPVVPTLLEAPMDKHVSYKDMVISESDGVLFTDYSERFQNLALKSMEFTLIVKVLGRRVGYNVLHDRICSIWKSSHPLKLIDLGHGSFLIEFASRKDYIHVLSDGPWTIFEHYLIVEPWLADFKSSQAPPSPIMAWIYLPQRAFLSASVVCTAVPFVNLMCLGVNLAMNLVFLAVFSAFFHREPFGSPHAAAPTSASFSHHRRVESTVGCALCGCILIVEPTWPLLALHRCYFLVTVVPSRTAKATTVDVGF
ncbi:hypothetical protein V6N11_080107 [Hibiscus sabdariffa]|uniref:DUF4283 domain-containing protein n=1 Tax=Hibiscus sabdariffa TaxID=183260 RepID=A0ABR2RXX3_9ROSI